MKIPTDTYEEKYEQYKDAIRWIESLDIKIDKGRLSFYDKTIKFWKDNYKTSSFDQAKDVFVDFVSSIFEIYDLINIHKTFVDIPAKDFTSVVAKLKKAVNGPINTSDETQKSTGSRNFLFEIITTARMHSPQNNMVAILNAPSDSGFKFNNYNIWVECKRITSKNKIESNVKKASKQLEKVFNSKVGSSHRGIVALDVSKIFHSGDKLLVAKNDTELQQDLKKKMNNFIFEYSKLWRKVYERRNKKIIGTMVRFSFMCVSEERNILVYNSQWAINPHNESPNNMVLLENILSVIKKTPWL